MLILKVINTLRDEECDQTRLFSFYMTTATDHEYCAGLQTSILSITRVQMLMYTCKLCVKCVAHEFFV